MKIQFAIIFTLGFIIRSYSQFPNMDSLIEQSTHLKGAEKILILSDISFYSTYINTDQGVEYGQKCLQEAFVYGDSLLIAEGFNALAIALYAKSDYENALKSNLRALDIRLRHGDDYSVMSSYSKIGNCMHELGQYDEAIDYYLKSLVICEKNGLTAQIGQISNNIAEIFKQQKKFEKSQHYYLKSIEIAKQTKDSMQLSISLLNLGVNYAANNEFDQADSLYTIAYSLIEGKNYLELEAGLMTNWGVVAQMKNKPEASIRYYKRALDIYEKTGEIYGLGLVYSNLGKSFTRTNQLDSALLYLEKGLELAQETSALPRIINAYNSLTDFYRTTGNFNLAFYYDSISDVLHDSIYNLENDQIMEELNTQYRTAEKESQIARQEKEIIENEIVTERKNNQIVGLIGGSIALILVMIIFYRSQKIKRTALQKEIELEKSVALNKVQNEKLRISRDLHDNIGAQLTFVISSLDNLNYVKNEADRQDKLMSITSFTKDTMHELRASIWTLKTDDLTRDEFNAKVIELINRAKIACPTIQFKIETTPSDQKLPASTIVPLFRTIQEALNNAIKHSKATEITFISTGNEFYINDNGIGFDPLAIEMGNGLNNMKNRIEELGMQLKMSSKIGKGTEIKIELNTIYDT